MKKTKTVQPKGRKPATAPKGDVPAPQEKKSRRSDTLFPIIGIGASADTPDALRRLAEKRMGEMAGRPAIPIKKEDMKKLIHELQVSRIEVEIQNEGLIQARDEVEVLLERSTNLYDFAPVGYFTLDRTGTIRNVNLTGAALLGLERSLVVDRRFQAFVSQDSLPGFNAFIKTVFERKTKQSCDVEIRSRNDQPNVVRIEADVAGAGQECFMAVADITERKRAEKALRGSEARLNSIVRGSPIPLFVIDLDHNVINWNEALENYSGIKLEDILGTNQQWRAFYPNERPCMADLLVDGAIEMIPQWYSGKYSKSKLIEDAYEATDFFPHMGESGIWMFFTAAPIRDENDRIIGAVETLEDITERKRVEEQLKHFNEELEKGIADRTAKLNASLEEKVVLLHEIHHRVKNNLQIIISLLNLQSRYIEDVRTKQLIQESQNRIRAMAFVHEKLCQSADIAKIDLDNYIRFLGDSLAQFYGMKGKGIIFNTRIQDINVDINTVIPVGLIVNELVSNSLKHAFPGGRKGEISIAIKRENNSLSILFADNGVGIPEDFDWRNANSLGLRLVVTLVAQLFGTIELDRTAGTTFTIVVKEKE